VGDYGRKVMSDDRLLCRLTQHSLHCGPAPAGIVVSNQANDTEYLPDNLHSKHH